MVALKDAASMIEKAEANTDRNTKKGFGAVCIPGRFIEFAEGWTKAMATAHPNLPVSFPGRVLV